MVVAVVVVVVVEGAGSSQVAVPGPEPVRSGQHTLADLQIRKSST